ncbi:hypothetical protein B2G71_15345 [Novosphingobium sp. PC22D]|uniref:MFS transporter n=1 Tax=Novosphingobium sp. PC22D TaxID=1962403 RepID=UPI000BEF7070|nr:MFS transporter [Novosphingobium sp. PC22D]PEQ11815.1 hypothetical protein B2G71_15345 [Novosphingobium sp. PC22D]
MNAGIGAPLSAREEWRANWPMVVAAMAGLSFASIPAATLGLFIAPLEQRFGWTRAEISFGMTIFALVSLPLAPFAGALVDRIGGRRVGLPGVAASGLAFAAFALLGGALVQWLLTWVVYSLAALGIRSVVWNTAISSAFSAGRGLAIAVVLGGLSLSQMAAPPLAEFFIANFGWRSAYLALGLGWAGIAFVLVLAFFKVRRPATATDRGPESAEAPALSGLTLGEAMRSLAMLRISLAIVIFGLVATGITIHMVPMLTGNGATRAEAASLAVVLGLGSLLGNLGAGWLTDRVRSALLPLACFALPGVGQAVLLSGTDNLAVLGFGIAALGLGAGAALQVGIYLSTRYAGLRHFGKIYGVISSCQAGASGIGPLVVGIAYDATQSYALVLGTALPLTALSALLVFGLGPYPDFERRSAG